MQGPRSRSRSLRTWTEIRLRAETDAVEDGSCGRDRQLLALRVNGLPTVTAPSVNSDESLVPDMPIRIALAASRYAGTAELKRLRRSSGVCTSESRSESMSFGSTSAMCDTAPVSMNGPGAAAPSRP